MGKYFYSLTVRSDWAFLSVLHCYDSWHGSIERSQSLLKHLLAGFPGVALDLHGLWETFVAKADTPTINCQARGYLIPVLNAGNEARMPGSCLFREFRTLRAFLCV